MILRRRMMGGETWDYEWDYTKGLLSNNGWSKATSGTASEYMTSNSCALKSPNSGYIRINNPSSFNKTSGVLEVVFSCSGFAPTGGKQNFRFCFSNGTNGIQVCAWNNKGLCLMDADSEASITALTSPLSANTDYLLRLILRENVGEVWLDGVCLTNNVNISTILYATNTSLWSQNANNNITHIKSVKLKLGRVF